MTSTRFLVWVDVRVRNNDARERFVEVRASREETIEVVDKVIAVGRTARVLATGVDQNGAFRKLEQRGAGLSNINEMNLNVGAIRRPQSCQNNDN
jgi:hypothetical protein